MVYRIDVELERLIKLGQTPRIIEVGSDLYDELLDEQNPTLIAPAVKPSETTSVYADKEVTEYQNYKVIRLEKVPKDYLNILS